MYPKTVLLLFAIAIGICAAAPAEDDSRIIGGEDAAPGAYPYVVSIRTFSNTHFCAGAILTNRTIVTAAHCISGRSPSSIIVYVGTNTLNSGGLAYEVDEILVYPNYTNIDLGNDLGLITLNDDIVWTLATQPIALNNNSIPEDLSVTFMGWGSTTYPGNPSNVLQFLNVRTIGVDDCVARYDDLGTIYNTSLCTYTKIGEGACNGDSGSPLTYGNTLVGVLSWGSPCARGYPDVFTRLSEYTEWILENAVNVEEEVQIDFE